MTKHYVIHVVGGTEPELRGPYKTARVRDFTARRLRKAKDEEDSFFWLNIHKGGVPSIGAYSNGFMEGIKGFQR
jgi:hypothetical protein